MNPPSRPENDPGPSAEPNTVPITSCDLRKPALVTGASSGIGLELAKLLAAAGHDLVLVARRESELQTLAASLARELGTRSHVVVSDLAQPGAATELARSLTEAGIELEILINNAGFGVHGPFATTDLQTELDMVQVNIVALTELSKHVIPGMIARGRGSVLNVASTAAFQPGPLMAVYYASKAYVLSLSEALAVELEGTGVNVIALCPGPTESGFQAAAGIGRSKLSGSLPSSAEVAACGMRALERGTTVAIAGTRNWWLVQSVRLLPRKLVARAVRRLQARRAVRTRQASR
jgi:short-subunit dehydrogenase